jgi:branched-chain amino acid transport system permease protein
MALAGAIGWAFERVMVRPVYGQHLKQILITMGGMIIGEELIKVIWGPEQRPLPLPEALRGSILIGDAAIEQVPRARGGGRPSCSPPCCTCSTARRSAC